MFLAFPAALFAAIALPLLAAIYLLRSRRRRVPVSSLLLWRLQRPVREGGLVVERLRTPLLFYLELAALALLVLAAAAPRIRSATAVKPLVAVLDDSYSMQARAGTSARERAARALLDEVENGGWHPVRLVLAGATPQSLGEARWKLDPALLERWTCMAVTADLDAAVALAFDLGGPACQVLVLTDHAPAAGKLTGSARWWAFGSSAPNTAIVAASRLSQGDERDRCLIEIANLSTTPQTTVLRIQNETTHGTAPSSSLTLAPGEERRFEWDGESATFRASLTEDALAIDNEAWLLPSPPSTVRVAQLVADHLLKADLDRALAATQAAVPTQDAPDLVLTDRIESLRPRGGEWVVRFAVEPDAKAYLGPFIADTRHALTQGLSLSGVIWGGGRSSLPGTAVVSAGDIPLVTDIERPDGRHDLWIRLRLALSTLQNTPNWPALIWNLLSWRQSALPGLDAANYRLGTTVQLTLPPGAETIRLIGPTGETKSLESRASRMLLPADRPGIFSVQVGASSYRCAVNATDARESSLNEAVSGRWEGPGEVRSARTQGTVPFDWPFALAALVIMSIHQVLVRGHRRAGTP